MLAGFLSGVGQRQSTISFMRRLGKTSQRRASRLNDRTQALVLNGQLLGTGQLRKSERHRMSVTGRLPLWSLSIGSIRLLEH